MSCQQKEICSHGRKCRSCSGSAHTSYSQIHQSFITDSVYLHHQHTESSNNMLNLFFVWFKCRKHSAIMIKSTGLVFVFNYYALLMVIEPYWSRFGSQMKHTFIWAVALINKICECGILKILTRQKKHLYIFYGAPCGVGNSTENVTSRWKKWN